MYIPMYIYIHINIYICTYTYVYTSNSNPFPLIHPLNLPPSNWITPTKFSHPTHSPLLLAPPRTLPSHLDTASWSPWARWSAAILLSAGRYSGDSCNTLM